MRRYFDAVNAAGGVNGLRIEYLSLDEGPSPQTAAGAARKLIADPEVVALVGGSGLFDCPVNAAAYAAADLVSLQGASVAPECFASSHIVPINNGPYLGLDNAITFAVEHLKKSRVCVSILELPGMAAGYQRALGRLKPSLKTALDDVAFISPDADFAAAIRERLARRWLQEAQKQGMGETDWIFLTPAYTDRVSRAIRDPKARLPLSALSQGGYVSAQLFVRVARQIPGPVTRASFARALRELPPTDLSFLGMPFHVGQAPVHAPNRASLPVAWRNGLWKIAAPVWIQAPPLVSNKP